MLGGVVDCIQHFKSFGQGFIGICNYCWVPWKYLFTQETRCCYGVAFGVAKFQAHGGYSGGKSPKQGQILPQNEDLLAPKRPHLQRTKY